eukprot:jgi/Picsp_1/2645/NSC_00875-R1_cathepsin l
MNLFLLLLLGHAIFFRVVSALSWREVIKGFKSDSLRYDPIPPIWPKSYSVSYEFSLPYTADVQQQAVRYDVRFSKFVNDRHSRLRIDSLNQSNILLIKHNRQYEIIPRLSEQICSVSSAQEEDLSLEALPNVDGWEFVGDLNFRGQDAILWQYEVQNEEKHIHYKFYMTRDQVPLRFHMLGTELFGGAHFDEWVMDYRGYDPDPSVKHVFQTPNLCQGKESYSGRSHAPRWKSMLPRVNYSGHKEYDAFLLEHNPQRLHMSLRDYQRRVTIYLENKDRISIHNSNPQRTFKMAMNKFGDWSRDEFLAVMLPNNKIDVGMDNNLAQDERSIPYKPKIDPSLVPNAVDWRGTPLAGKVKDQANCGSCWAFGAVGAMEAAWTMFSGKPIQLSEQQVMDCSWGYVPGREGAASACNGGDAYAGVGHIVQSGGIATSEEYAYLGQGYYCRENETLKVARFKGYSKVPRYNDQALMEAVYSHGPVAVSLDASQDSFTFYSSGVYLEAKCMWRPDQLDHSMMLVGYGTDPVSGLDYWLIKNSWSIHWGDNGYVKVARSGHGCGASTDALYAIVDDSEHHKNN